MTATSSSNSTVRWFLRRPNTGPARRSQADATTPTSPGHDTAASSAANTASTASRTAANPAIDTPVARHTRLLVLQPTPFCNIACSYCYLPDRGNTARMSLATVRQAVQRLVDDGLAGPRLTVVWHAGEPLVMPLAFYEQAFDTINQVLGTGTRVSHSVQTNAMLIDDDWCALFKRHGVRVGISLDGPADLHDRHRRTRQGQGTHAQVMQGLARLQAHGLAPHAIAVVSRDTLDQPDAFFDFFLAHGIRELGCNFDEAEGAHTHSSLAGHEAAHRGFLARLLQRQQASGGQLVVRELAQAHQLVAAPLPRYAWAGSDWPDNAQVLPLAIITVGHDGRFGTFSPELLGQATTALAGHAHATADATDWAGFAIGDLAQGGYRASLAMPAFQRQWQAVAQGIQACAQQCAYFNFCGGGAPVNKLFEAGSLSATETLYCRSMLQAPFDTVLQQLEARQTAAPPAHTPASAGQAA